MIARTTHFRLWTLSELMERFPAAQYLDLIRTMTSVLEPNRRDAKEPLRGPLDADLRTTLQDFFARYVLDFSNYSLATASTSAKKLLGALEDATTTYDQVWALVEELQGRVIDGMGENIVFILTPREAQYFNVPQRGWEQVLARFQDALRDVEEASKCFALARYAASVFHSTQVIEMGLIELGKFISIVDPKSGFSAVCNELKKVLGKDYTVLTPFEKQHREFLEQIYGTAEALKNAWRNKISHAQGKLVLLTADFTPEVAEEILFASRAFMRRLAEYLPS